MRRSLHICHNGVCPVPAGATDGDVHLVVTPQTVELVDDICGEAGAALDLPGGGCQLHPAAGTLEVVGVVVVSLPLEGATFYTGVAPVEIVDLILPVQCEVY